MGKGKKGKEIKNAAPFVPMPKSWPGKISDPNLFESFAKQVQSKVDLAKENPLVRFKIKQHEWDFNEMLISLPKSTTIYRLKCEVVKLLHASSISPLDILIYAQKPEKDIAPKEIDNNDLSLSECFPSIDGLSHVLTKSGQASSVHASQLVLETKHPYVFGKSATKHDKEAYNIYYDVKPYLNEVDYTPRITNDLYDPNKDLIHSHHMYIDCGIVRREPAAQLRSQKAEEARKAAAIKKDAEQKSSNRFHSVAKGIITTLNIFKPFAEEASNRHITPELNNTIKTIKEDLKKTQHEAQKSISVV